jgi:hypothetical protein
VAVGSVSVVDGRERTALVEKVRKKYLSGDRSFVSTSKCRIPERELRIRNRYHSQKGISSQSMGGALFCESERRDVKMQLLGSWRQVLYRCGEAV